MNELLSRLGALGERVRTQEPLSRHTSLGIGGPAEAYVEVSSVDELVSAVAAARAAGVAYLVLGGGTNILVSDQGCRGLVIRNHSKELTTQFFSETGERPSPEMFCLVRGDSGISLAYVASLTADLGLCGLEWAVGIPGTLGGAVVGNAGAFDGDMADIVRTVELLTPSGERLSVPTTDLDFGYRTSSLKQGPLAGHIVLSAILSLVREPVAEVKARVQACRVRRLERQPSGKSAGSVFKNPPGDSAGRLLDSAGLKGTRIGDALVSEKHANYFLNAGKATASDMLQLIRLAQQRVHEQSGVRLELEIGLIGEWEPEIQVGEQSTHAQNA